MNYIVDYVVSGRLHIVAGVTADDRAISMIEPSAA
jgi:hypothetical protein